MAPKKGLLDLSKTKTLMGSLADYEHIQVIGKGSFGIVSKIRRKADGKVHDIILY